VGSKTGFSARFTYFICNYKKKWFELFEGKDNQRGEVLICTAAGRLNKS